MASINHFARRVVLPKFLLRLEVRKFVVYAINAPKGDVKRHSSKRCVAMTAFSSENTIYCTHTHTPFSTIAPNTNILSQDR